jgi:predicted amidohydrolase
MSNALTLHLVQWRVIPGNVEGNLDTAGRLIAAASPDKGDMVLLPELFPSGFYYPDLEKIAGEQEAVLKWMGAAAEQYSAAVAGSIPTLRPEGVANTFMFVEKSGQVLASYDKIHLFFAADEDLHFVPGGNTVVACWRGVKIGLAICFDLRFPELTRELCDRGAQLVLVPAQWPRARVDHFRDFVRVRAMENQVFVAACNSCGDDGKGLVLGGGSTVVGPAGDVKGALGDDEGVLTVNFDLDEVGRIRSSFPVLKVRRKDLFGK